MLLVYFRLLGTIIHVLVGIKEDLNLCDDRIKMEAFGGATV